MLQVYLLSSRTFLSQQMQNTPLVNTPHTPVGGNTTTPPQALEEEREKLRGALVLTQESAAVQILLEACLMNSDEKVGTLTVSDWIFKVVVYGEGFYYILSCTVLPWKEYKDKGVCAISILFFVFKKWACATSWLPYLLLVFLIVCCIRKNVFCT